jgi:hypothetical protein
VPELGLFWQTGDDDGMEIDIPRRDVAAEGERYEAKAAAIEDKLQAKLWDPQRGFFFRMAQRDEELDGHTVEALTLTYETGRFAGSPHGGELIGYAPWQFNLPDPG